MNLQERQRVRDDGNGPLVSRRRGTRAAPQLTAGSLAHSAARSLRGAPLVSLSCPIHYRPTNRAEDRPRRRALRSTALLRAARCMRIYIRASDIYLPMYGMYVHVHI